MKKFILIFIPALFCGVVFSFAVSLYPQTTVNVTVSHKESGSQKAIISLQLSPASSDDSHVVALRKGNTYIFSLPDDKTASEVILHLYEGDEQVSLDKTEKTKRSIEFSCRKTGVYRIRLTPIQGDIFFEVVK